MLRYRFAASYAGVALQIVSWSVMRGRDVIRHRPARGGGAQLSDRGQREREDHIAIQLVGTDDEITRRRDALSRLSESGQARTFVHPLDGRWFARLVEFTEQAGPDGVSYSMTLVEDRSFAARLAQAIQADESSLEDVLTAASAFDSARAAAVSEAPQLASEVKDAGDARAMAERWDPDQTSGAELIADMDHYRADAAQAQARLDRERRRSAYQAGIALLDLRGHIERYRRRIERLAPHMFALEVLADVPLITLLADLYGGAEANRLANDVIRINSIIAPVRVRAGTVLRLPALA